MTAAPRGTDPDPPVRRPIDSVFIDSPTMNLVYSDLIFFFLSFFPWIQPNRKSINRSSQRDEKKRFCQSNQKLFFCSCCCCAFPRRVTKLTGTTAHSSDGWNEENTTERQKRTIQWSSNAKQSKEGNDGSEWCWGSIGKMTWEKANVGVKWGMWPGSDGRRMSWDTPAVVYIEYIHRLPTVYLYLYIYILTVRSRSGRRARRANTLDWSSSCKQKVRDYSIL